MGDELSVVAELAQLVQVRMPLSYVVNLFLYCCFYTHRLYHLTFYIYVDLKLWIMITETFVFLIFFIFVNSGDLLQERGSFLSSLLLTLTANLRYQLLTFLKILHLNYFLDRNITELRFLFNAKDFVFDFIRIQILIIRHIMDYR